MEEIDEYYTCRICLDDELRRCDVIAPCSCAGSSKWVHRACLDQWRTTREDRAFSRCTECLTDYELIPRPEYEAPEMQTKRRRKYIALMVRDIGGMFALTQAVIIAMAFLVYACDSHEKHLITQAHMLAYPRLFYYLTGLIISSAVAGIIGTIVMCIMSTTGNDGVCCTNSTGDCAYLCYGCGDCSGCSCEGAQCAAGACECGEAGPFVLIILGAFAVIGAIMIVVAGVMFIQQVVKTHASVLYKRGLAQEFVVADLDAADKGLSALPPVEVDGEEGGTSDPDDGGHSLRQTVELSHVYSSLSTTTSTRGGAADLETGMTIIRDSDDLSASPHDLERDPLVVTPTAPPSGSWSDSIDSHHMLPSAPELSLAQRQELASRGLL